MYTIIDSMVLVDCTGTCIEFIDNEVAYMPGSRMWAGISGKIKAAQM